MDEWPCRVSINTTNLGKSALEFIQKDSDGCASTKPNPSVSVGQSATPRPCMCAYDFTAGGATPRSRYLGHQQAATA